MSADDHLAGVRQRRLAVSETLRAERVEADEAVRRSGAEVADRARATVQALARRADGRPPPGVRGRR